MPLLLNDSSKLDGTNWSWWSNNIQTMAQMQGVHGYLDGSILMPSTPTIQPKDGSTIPETPWNSTTPSLDEWKTWDAWTKILLTINIKDVDGLGINTTGTAASIWKMAKDNCEITSEMTKINAQEELRTIKYTDDDDFSTYLSIMHCKLSQVRAMETTISDNTFKVILLNSLPKTWNPAVAPLYNNTSLTEAIQ